MILSMADKTLRVALARAAVLRRRCDRAGPPRSRPRRSSRRSPARCPSTRGRSRVRSAAGIRIGVTEALSRFVTLIRDPGTDQEPAREVYVGLGRGELRQGRSLDSLQAAYRVGARVAWRRTSEACLPRGHRARGRLRARRCDLRLHRRDLGGVGRGVRGRAAAREGERELRRGRLLAALAGGSAAGPPAGGAIGVRGGLAGPDGRPPRSPARSAERRDRSPAARVETLAGRLGDLGCVVLADPGARGAGRRSRAPARAGPPPSARSWRPGSSRARGSEARATLSALESGALGADAESGPCGPRSISSTSS